jgi:hypothetical protein
MIRSSDRHLLQLPVKLRVAETQPDAVQFGDGHADAEGWVELKLINISTGGIGLESPIFLPRGGEFRVRGNFGDNWSGFDGDTSAPGGASIETEIEVSTDPDAAARRQFDIHACVRRVAMTDTQPRYEIGLSFVDLSEVMSERVEAFLNVIAERDSVAASIGGGAS